MILNQALATYPRIAHPLYIDHTYTITSSLTTMSNEPTSHPTLTLILNFPYSHKGLATNPRMAHLLYIYYNLKSYMHITSHSRLTNPSMAHPTYIDHNLL